mmetsp:Transcript_24021/g.29187  ORF Transcript_24021/g.29187 Transcript_24021/m.29187 type:complete len:138 (+) Transcript_24021:75-488(+)
MCGMCCGLSQQSLIVGVEDACKRDNTMEMTAASRGSVHCPFEVIDALLRVYPHGARLRDDLGILPLQLAKWKDCSERIINALLAVFPEGDTLYDPTKTVVLDNSPTIKRKTTLTTRYLREEVEVSVSNLSNPTIICN